MSGAVSDAFAIIAKTLIEEGFQLEPGIEPSFRGVLREGGGDFELSIRNIDPNFEKLPEVYLTKYPTELPALLPHVERSNKLCFLDREGTYLDPFYPARTTRVLIGAVRSTLRNLTDPTQVQHELAGEFWAYWEPHVSCLLATEQHEAVAGFCFRSDLNGVNQKELVIAADPDKLQDWCLRRQATLEETMLGRAIIIRMPEAPCINVEQQWPPSSWLTFLDWLQRRHPETEKRLLWALLSITRERSTSTVVLHSDRSGPFGVRIEFVPQLQNIAARFPTKSCKGTNRAAKGNQLRRFRQTIRSKQLVKKFIRLSVSDISERFVYERNLRTPSLSNRKIALIGCGTVGSLAAQLLQKAGAGTGSNGHLDLFDGDSLNGGNLGRHLLGTEYLLEPKGRSVADFLTKTAASQVSIIGRADFITKNLYQIRDFDLVIDATGEETFSSLLARQAHQLRCEKKRAPPMLHAWVDAGGYAVRALLDDGTGACYRCLKVQKQGQESGAVEERFPLFVRAEDEESASVVAHRCGESYVPFAGGISSVAAGMVQQMALAVFQDDPGPRFRHQSHAQFVRGTKDQSPSRKKDCPCCSPFQI